MVTRSGTSGTQPRRPGNAAALGADAESFWEKQYRSRRAWGGRAEPLLVETAEPLRPGTVLDLGCGAGGDTIWLAQHGWHVTAWTSPAQPSSEYMNASAPSAWAAG
jgi:hypothetical protein